MTAKKLLDIFLRLPLAFVAFYFFIILSIEGRLPILFYSDILIRNAQFIGTFSVVSLFLYALLIICTPARKNQEQKSFKAKIQESLHRYRQRFSPKKNFFIFFILTCLFIHIFVITIGYPILLVSTKLYTDKLTTTGNIVDKQESRFKIYRRYASMTFPIREITVQTEDNKSKKFNLANFHQEWSKIQIGDEIQITHYPFIHDADLQIQVK